jgi:hypothetical protein
MEELLAKCKSSSDFTYFEHYVNAQAKYYIKMKEMYQLQKDIEYNKKNNLPITLMEIFYKIKESELELEKYRMEEQKNYIINHEHKNFYTPEELEAFRKYYSDKKSNA